MSGTDEEQGDEIRDFGRRFSEFIQWAHTFGGSAQQPVTSMLREHLGERVDQPAVRRQWSAFEQVNVQRALDHWIDEESRDVRVQGLSVPPHFSEISLGQLLDGEHLPPVRMSTPDITDLPAGPGRTLACWNCALLLVHGPAGAFAVLISGPQEHQEPSVSIEVAGLPVPDAQAVFAEIERLRNRLNVYRGQVVTASMNAMGAVALTFATLEPVERNDVILPEPVIARIERHALGVSQHAVQLTASGQHLKRGLLLYGPPGTGKTHTVRYLVGARTDATRVLLQGESLRAVGQIASLARELAPGIVVLEDVDLVAEDRSYGDVNPVLFELLDAMDGSAPDADLLFVLTTNRAEVLERALVQRPGRVDVAVEVGRPDVAARTALLRLYGADVLDDLTGGDIDAAVGRTEGVTASFLKELIRRAVLTALADGRHSRVRADDLREALDDLLDQTQSVTRSLLGVLSGAEPTDREGQ
ncbi:ATP-binding protein [Dermatophilaceae bacterium Sec6.4]